MVVEKKLGVEVAEQKDRLSDNDYKAIEAEVLAEEKGDKPAEKEEVVQEEQKEEIQETAEEKEAREKQEQETATAEAEKLAVENKRLLEAKPEDLNDDEKSKREELLKAQEEADKEKEVEDKKFKEQLDTEVKNYATEHKINEDEARSDFESRDKILEKYKSDPKQLALANLHLQRMYAKSQEAVKAAEEAKPLKSIKALTNEDCIKLIDSGEITLKGKKITREDAIAIYREQFPDISEDLEDAAIIKLVAKEIKEGYTKNQEKSIAAISVSAKEKRSNLINSLPEEAKKYIPEIQPLLEKYPDSAVVAESFDIADLVNYVKGKHYDKDVKEFGEKEYKRGLAQAKIVGLKPTPNNQGSQRTPVKSKVNLTERQKKDALSMYEGTTFTEDEKFANYAELFNIK
jgi:hypothetical protein